MAAYVRCDNGDELESDEFMPDDPDMFHVRVRLWIGSNPDGRSGDDFHVTITTPSYLDSQMLATGNEIIMVKPYILVRHFEHALILQNIREALDEIEETSWVRVAVILHQMASWEFFYAIFQDGNMDRNFAEREPK